MKEQVDVKNAIEQIQENVDIYNIDLAIEKFQDFISITENQINHLRNEHDRIWNVVKTLKKCREIMKVKLYKAQTFKKFSGEK